MRKENGEGNFISHSTANYLIAMRLFIVIVHLISVDSYFLLQRYLNVGCCPKSLFF